jgi:AcrR family transcriptional regulator
VYLPEDGCTILTLMSITRSRLSPDESRAAALEAARVLLIEEGPQAVTLKAVSARIGRTHANLLHHFGSAAELQAALARLIGERVTAQIGEAVERARAGEADPREVVDRTFDAFGREGGGALAAWMILSGDRAALNPILESIHRLVDRLGEGHEDRPVHETTLWLVLAALGDSLMGAPMAEALGLPREKARELARAQLIATTKIGAKDEQQPLP